MESDERAPVWCLDERRDTCSGARQYRQPLTERRPGTDCPTPRSGACTTGKLPRYPPQPPDGQESASLCAIAKPVKYFFPRNADRTVSIQIVEPLIQLVALCARERDRLRPLREAFPDLLQELQSFLGAFWAGVSSPRRVSPAVTTLSCWATVSGKDDLAATRLS
jgi:hypothetical protein